jgi:hypothetical protein
MLDVHPPEHAAHTWRDFLIHIATIVIGLLIAVGLEQTVEYIHHRHQLSEVHESLRLEREQNRKNFIANTAEFRLESAYLQNDLMVLHYLQQHPGTQEDNLPGVMVYTLSFEPMIDSAWKTAQQTGVTNLMRPAEVTGNDAVYTLCTLVNNDALAVFQNVNLAKQYSTLDPDLSHLTPAQIDEQIKLTQKGIISLYEWGLILATVHANFPDFTVGPTHNELRALTGSNQSPQDIQRRLLAQQKTDARTQALKDAYRAADKAAEAK